MNKGKTGKSGDGDAITDPLLVRDCLGLLLESDGEFSIKVEGTATLPYSSRVQSFDENGEQFVLRLVRPLPHELLAGATFRMLFTAGDQRFEALIDYEGREAYLQYRFELPERLMFADRRLHPRFPFRPRENAYVTASDGRMPSLGIAGPLVNISMGGLAVRVDRVLKLEDGVRIPSNTALFEKGLSFPRIRIQDLPRLPFLELGGRVAHASEHGGEVVLGLVFDELEEDKIRLLHDCLDFRERMFKGSRTSSAPGAVLSSSPFSQGSMGQTPKADGPPGESREMDPIPFAVEPGGGTPDPLLVLNRRVQRLLLVARNRERTARFQREMRAAGFVRLEIFDELSKAESFIREHGGKVGLVIVDLALAGTGDVEPLAAVRNLERQMAFLGGIPRAILCETVDPTLLLGDFVGTRFLSHGDAADRMWVEALDSILELGNGYPPSE